MTTIVLNTLTSAVTEYDWAFQSITPTHAGDASGLYELGGDTDAGLEIDARIDTGQRMWGESLKRSISAVFVAARGVGQCALTVHGQAAAWRYQFPIRPSGVSRSPVGKGIRENYIGFALENTDGAAFSLDRIEVLDVTSTSRRS